MGSNRPSAPQNPSLKPPGKCPQPLSAGAEKRRAEKWAGALYAEAVRCILPVGRESKMEISGRKVFIPIAGFHRRKTYE